MSRMMQNINTFIVAVKAETHDAGSNQATGRRNTGRSIAGDGDSQFVYLHGRELHDPEDDE